MTGDRGFLLIVEEDHSPVHDPSAHARAGPGDSCDTPITSVGLHRQRRCTRLHRSSHEAA